MGEVGPPPQSIILDTPLIIPGAKAFSGEFSLQLKCNNQEIYTFSQGKSLGSNIYRVLKNNVYNVSGMIAEVKTNMFFIWQNFGLCTVLPLDGLMGRWLDFRHNTHRLVLFVLLYLQQVERVITVNEDLLR